MSSDSWQPGATAQFWIKTMLNEAAARGRCPGYAESILRGGFDVAASVSLAGMILFWRSILLSVCRLASSPEAGVVGGSGWFFRLIAQGS